MSALPSRPSDAREAVAGLMASAALFTSLFGVVYKPARLIPVAAVMAMVAARMTERHARLAALAVAAAVICWTVGMTIAVVTERALY
ncbi:MAG: hypothetical protein H0T13_03915 [Actinobacteria bacterium]|nr:hypothetical protein [Actinomycetota bacterium]